MKKKILGVMRVVTCRCRDGRKGAVRSQRKELRVNEGVQEKGPVVGFLVFNQRPDDLSGKRTIQNHSAGGH